MQNSSKSFGLWSAIFLGIGSMVGAGIFVLLGEAGAIAGNLVWISFILGGLIALLSGYSLGKLSIAYPSRGGIIEYLVQCYGEGFFSGTISILFYLSALVALSMVAKTFGTYATILTSHYSTFWVDIYTIGILFLFMLINLSGSLFIAKSENIIVIFKLSILIIFTLIAFFYLNPNLLQLKDAPLSINIFYSIGLTFFAYEGFRVITNTVEDIDNPNKNMLKAMIISILLVMILYIAVSFAVFGNLPLNKIINAKDYALAEAAKPAFGKSGFIIMSIAALVSTASSINANLYAVTNVTYQMAKDGELPKIYERNIWHSTQGLLISTIIIIILILFLDLTQIATIGSITMLFIHAIVHLGHIFKIKETRASNFLVFLAIISIIIVIFLALNYSSKFNNNIGYYITSAFIIAFILEVILRLTTKRVIKKQS